MRKAPYIKLPFVGGAKGEYIIAFSNITHIHVEFFQEVKKNTVNYAVVHMLCGTELYLVGKQYEQLMRAWSRAGGV